MARPPKSINWDIVEKKMEAGCTAREIAGGFHIDETTFGIKFQKEYGCYFTEYLERFHSHEGGKGNIKFRQYAKAMEGNVTMLLRLGEVWLGQGKTEESQVTPEMIEKFESLIQLMHYNQSLTSERKIAESNNNDAQKS